MAKSLVRDFGRLRVLTTSLDLRQRMDALVQDLSQALEMEEGAGTGVGGGSSQGVLGERVGGARGHSKGKRRNWKRRSKSAGSLTPVATAAGRVAASMAYHSDDSSSSLGEVVFSQEKSSMHQTDSDDASAGVGGGGGGGSSSSRQRLPPLPLRAWKTVVAMAAAAAAAAATTPTNPAGGSTLANAAATTTTTGGSLAESDSLNENLGPAAMKGQARRKRKFKRMAVDEDGAAAATVLLPPPQRGGMKAHHKKKRGGGGGGGSGRGERMEEEEGYESVVCGKRKRSARERSLECERTSPRFTHARMDVSDAASMAQDLDHTADVQLHAWGQSLEEAFEQCAMAMFGYMTEIESVQILETQDVEAEGHDMLSLFYHFLDEFLFVFSADPFFIARKVKILEMDRENFRIRARGYGETFDLDKHPQGSEVKAITYSNMQVHEHDANNCEVFVIIDI